VVQLLPGVAGAQIFGNRAAPQWPQTGLPATADTLDHRAIENFITIEGKAEKRLDPTALRVVLAIMVDQPTARECQAVCHERQEKLRAELVKLKLDPKAIVVDFISVLPVYEWNPETRKTLPVLVEEEQGFRMQSNVHVEVPNEELAQEVLQAAFKLDISDVIAVDYFNKHVDEFRRETRKEALQAAKEKAELLLGALFDEIPHPLNVHESTRVIHPQSLYSSSENVYAQRVSSNYYSSGDRTPRISAARPKNTYFRGLQEDADVKSPGVPLRPQISVVSTVRLYFATPGSEDDDDDESGD